MGLVGGMPNPFKLKEPDVQPAMTIFYEKRQLNSKKTVMLASAKNEATSVFD